MSGGADQPNWEEVERVMAARLKAEAKQLQDAPDSVVDQATTNGMRAYAATAVARSRRLDTPRGSVRTSCRRQARAGGGG